MDRTALFTIRPWLASGEWTDIDQYTQLAPENLGGGYLSQGLQAGDTFGRDQTSTDTNSVDDWVLPGGLNARGSTVSAVNDDYPNNTDFIFPLINEVMFSPDRDSREITKRRKFVELYRPRASITGERFGLEGCTIVNSEGPFRVDFGDSFDTDILDETSNPYPYVTIKEKSTLEKDLKVSRSNGIIWIRSMPLETKDSLAIFCDGNMVVYVAWSNLGYFGNTHLHQTAVDKKQWSGINDYVATTVIQLGESLGRDADGSDTNTIDDWAVPGGVDAEGAETPGSRNGPEDLPTLGPTSGPTSFFSQRPSESPRPSQSPSLSMSPSEMSPTQIPVSEPSSSPNVQASRAVLAVPTRSPTASLSPAPTDLI